VIKKSINIIIVMGKKSKIIKKLSNYYSDKKDYEIYCDKTFYKDYFEN